MSDQSAFAAPVRAGWIEVIAGVMFSGKSEELVRRVRRAVIAKKRVQVFKSHLDARYAGLYSVSTHDGGTVEAEPVDSSEGVIRAVRSDTEVVAVDEVQFLDDGIVAAANDLADRGVRVMLAGIDHNGAAGAERVRIAGAFGGHSQAAAQCKRHSKCRNAPCQPRIHVTRPVFAPVPYCTVRARLYEQTFGFT